MSLWERSQQARSILPLSFGMLGLLGLVLGGRSHGLAILVLFCTLAVLSSKSFTRQIHIGCSANLLCVLAPFIPILLLIAVQMPTDLAWGSFHLILFLTATFLFGRSPLLHGCAFLFGFLLLLLMGAVKTYEQEYAELNFDAITAIMESNALEASVYLDKYLTPARVFWSCLPLALCGAYCFFIRRRRGVTLAIHPMGILMVGAVTLAVTVLAAANARSRVGYILASARSFHAEVLAQQRAIVDLNLELESMEFQPNQDPQLLVVVIGESTSRHHLSLYGYPKKTTPKLDALRKELVVHEDAISPHSHSRPSLQYVLTANRVPFYRPEPIDFKKTLVADLRRLGHHVSWISNHHEFGAWENTTSLIAKQSDQAIFVRHGSGKTYREGYFDQYLLPFYRKAISQEVTAKVVFVHLYTGHSPYCQAVPPDHEVVTPSPFSMREFMGSSFVGRSYLEKQLNCYDSAMAYLDSILAELIQPVQDYPDPATLVYFADHGEAPYYETGHNSGSHSSYHIEVPLVFYFNNKAREKHEKGVQALKQNADRPFSTENIYSTVLHMAGGSLSESQREKSLFSSDYKSTPRYTMPINGKRSIAYDEATPCDRKDDLYHTRQNKRLIQAFSENSWSKVFAARVNTVGVLWEAKRYFSGVEIDIEYLPNEADFFIQDEVLVEGTLSLSRFLLAVSDKPEMKIWFNMDSIDGIGLAPEELFGSIRERFSLEGRAFFHVSRTNRKEFAGIPVISSFPDELSVTCQDKTQASKCHRKIKAFLGEEAATSSLVLGFETYQAVGRFLEAEYPALRLFLESGISSASSSFALPESESIAGVKVRFPSRFR